jgi:hypothetical protein
MSKKQYRKVSRGGDEKLTTKTPAQTVEVKTNRPGVGRQSVSLEFNPDYTYVIKDLKRIGILAGSFFVILVVLSFILK